MKIYLVRHGEAEGAEINPERPLTKNGEKQVILLASTIRRKHFAIDEIIHSGVLRAEQTALILQKELGLNHPVNQGEDLLPGSDPKVWFDQLHQSKKNIMLVGHMPFMGILGEMLIKNQMRLGFSTAAMVSFRFEEGEFHLDWKSQ
ncbi:MAG: phosphohistidine phosphatase [Bacteriovoracaceae bacterium]|jgi:phosphohistidine phosphatase